jgi:hypothetical protein
MGEARERIRSFIEAGATHVILNLIYPYPEQIVHRLVDEIITPLTR